MQLYRTLQLLFPYDRPVYEEMLQKGRPFYTLISYAMYCEGEFVGHAGLLPLKIWFGGQLQDIIGVAAVATMPKFRRMGVAQRLMEYCAKLIDRRNSPSVLFTGLPLVYQSHGFNAVEQTYVASKIGGAISLNKKYEYRLYDVLSPVDTRTMEFIYTHSYPNYDGKVYRDELYWDLYRMLFNPYQKLKIISARNGRGFKGYVRFESEGDRLTVTELCCGLDDMETAESLIAAAWEDAKKRGIELCTFALPKDHFVWNILADREIECRPEPQGVEREVFMVRPVKGRDAGLLGSIQWSLADKF